MSLLRPHKFQTRLVRGIIINKNNFNIFVSLFKNRIKASLEVLRSIVMNDDNGYFWLHG